MSKPNLAIETTSLGKRFGSKWALEECSIALPRGSITALVGPNGAGKSTLLQILAGVTPPTAGEFTIAGSNPRAGAEALSRIGYLDQARVLYRDFRVSEMLRFGRALNPRWDDAVAREALDRLGISLRERVGGLSSGQQSQLALTLCLAKRPEVLLLDEPTASLDPLAREEVMHLLLASVVESGTTVLLASHAVTDLAVFCDHVVLIAGGRVRLVDALDAVLVSHRLLVGESSWAVVAPEGMSLIDYDSTGRQATMLVRTDRPVDPSVWTEHQPTLDEIVVGYLRRDQRTISSRVERAATAETISARGLR